MNQHLSELRFAKTPQVLEKYHSLRYYNFLIENLVIYIILSICVCPTIYFTLLLHCNYIFMYPYINT